MAQDYREADLPARDRVLLDYAVALTCEPAEREICAPMAQELRRQQRLFSVES